MTNFQAPPAIPSEADGGLAALRGAAAGMMPQWAAGRPPEVRRPVSPSRINGVVVPPGSARLLDSMSDYGD